jgi:hypothetical protein
MVRDDPWVGEDCGALPRNGVRRLRVRQTILYFAVLCVFGVSQDLFASQLNKWTAINAGLAALRARYPDEYQDLILKYRPFVAKYDDGVWHVSGKSFVPGGRAPVIEVRDRDEKILKISLAR